jgi:cell division protein FtsI (penicillin-binding protein 3)
MVVSMLVALEDGLIHPDDLVDTRNGVDVVAGEVLHDHNYDRGGYGVISAAQTIRYSSNIGVAKLIEKAYGHQPGKFVDGVYRIGFHHDMQLEIPGAATPLIPHPKDSKHRWPATKLPWMAFGYETGISPIYILSFFNAIANDGKLLKPLFVREIRKEGHLIERRKPVVLNNAICSSSTLKLIRQMLDDVVNTSDGTGKPAQSDKVRIAGKTSTAQLLSATSGGRSGGKSHQVAFCGYFPSNDPQYSMIVLIRKPRIGIASGGLMCGTVFKAIAEEMYAKNKVRNPSVFPVDTVFPSKPEIKRTVADAEIEAGRVPDVKGMGAKDAVYALETSGLQVRLTGQGTVVAQSIAPGSLATKGQTVGLQLK